MHAKQKAGLFLRKSLGQHLLTDRNTIRKEVSCALPLDNSVVLEIGCGTGLLTEELARQSKKVVAIEKDPRLLQECKQRLAQYQNIEYMEADALKMEFPLFDKLVSNLPYSISSKILFKILEHDFELAVVILQKEFAERLVAKAGEKDYSRLSVNAYLKADVELLGTVSRNCFHPAPLVDSEIVRMRKKETALPENFDAVVRALFQHRRKSVKNALADSSHELGLKKADAKKLFADFPEKKVFSLAPEDIVELCKAVREKLRQGTTRTYSSCT